MKYPPVLWQHPHSQAHGWANKVWEGWVNALLAASPHKEDCCHPTEAAVVFLNLSQDSNTKWMAHSLSTSFHAAFTQCIENIQIKVT